MKLAVFFLATAGLSAPVQAQIFKCVSPTGAVTFAQVPCPPGGGESQYLGEVNRSVQPENSLDVVERNLRAAEIMRGEGRIAARGPNVTVVKDSSRAPTINDLVRERMEREAAGAADGAAPKPRRRVSTNCLTVGKITNCHGSDGSSSTTTRFGNTSHTTIRE